VCYSRRMTDDAKDQPERIQTDESLRRERERADRALAATQQRVEAAAAAVVRSVQEGAEARVEEARAEADEKAVHHGPSTEGQRLAHAEAHAQVEAGRAAADQAALEEKEAAEEALRRARQEQARVLARLLPLEREKTDRYLLTERRRADDAVAHRDDFLNIVTHDLRNLLSGIVLSSDALAEIAAEGDTGPTLQSTTARIQRYAARMNRLIEDLVDVGSIDRGRLAIEPAQGDLAPLLAESVDGFASTAAAKGITLKHPHLDHPLLAIFDRGRILQVLANLLSNAIKFTPRGGEVDLRCERTSDALRVSVCDTGGGIAETMLESVFERFWQVGKNDRRGLGLGLYISRCIVEAHGGTIWVESELGHGARFTFELPARGP
jgi:signal transduction histidine kinase